LRSLNPLAHEAAGAAKPSQLDEAGAALDIGLWGIRGDMLNMAYQTRPPFSFGT